MVRSGGMAKRRLIKHPQGNNPLTTIMRQDCQFCRGVQCSFPAIAEPRATAFGRQDRYKFERASLSLVQKAQFATALTKVARHKHALAISVEHQWVGSPAYPDSLLVAQYYFPGSNTFDVDDFTARQRLTICGLIACKFFNFREGTRIVWKRGSTRKTPVAIGFALLQGFFPPPRHF